MVRGPGKVGLTADRLVQAVETAAAIRREQKLQPVGGPGDKVFPPTYPGERKNAPPRYVLEQRRINGQNVSCVLLDSVQSQANRLEQALLDAICTGKVAFPHIAVDFSNEEAVNGIAVDDLGVITCLDAPHRIFDAIIRDSQFEGVNFTDTEHYRQLILAKPTNALAVFARSPVSLLLGAWNSTGQGGGLGSRFARCIVSEIVGVGVADGATAAVRIDPLGILSQVKVVGSTLDWRVAGPDERKGQRPSEINHSNIIVPSSHGGVTIDYALHTTVITCAGLRRLKFPDIATEEQVFGRAVLAALGLLAVVEQDTQGYALRSRCDLACTGLAPFEIVAADGSTTEFVLDVEGAVALFESAVEAAVEAGFPWSADPLQLRPQARLVELVAASRKKALAGEADDKKGA
jgi:CRISPR-associated protein Csb1